MDPQKDDLNVEEILTHMQAPLSSANRQTVSEYLRLASKTLNPFPNADAISDSAKMLARELKPLSDDTPIPLWGCDPSHSSHITMKALRSALDYLGHVEGPSPKQAAKGLAAEFARILEREFKPPKRGRYGRLKDVAAVIHKVIAGSRTNTKRAVDAMIRSWRGLGTF